MIKDLAILTVFPACMAFAAAYDLFTMTLPNRLAILIGLGFLCVAPLAGLGFADIGMHLLIAAAALLIGIFLFAMGWIGGGDAKLFAATVLWLDPQALLVYVIMLSIFGGALTLLLLAYRQLPLPAILMEQHWIARLHRADEGVPYGIAMAAGGLIAYSHTPFMAALGH